MRRGQVIVVVAIMMITLIALAGLSIDVGLAYRQKSAMQSAADAAALTACIDLPDDAASPSKCTQAARALAALNGFTHGVNGCSVTGQTSVAPNPPSCFEVVISQPYNTLFVRLVGATSITMSVLARAQYFALSPVSIDGGRAPGQTGNIAILTMFGPWALHEYGDQYSTKFTNAGGANPTYQANGLDFSVVVPSNYAALNGTNLVKFEIFDPNSDAAGDNINQTKNTPPNVTIPTGSSNTPHGAGTTTKYSLFPPTSNANNLSTQTPINSFTEDTDSADSSQWVNPPGWTVDTSLSTNGTGKYRINVQTIDGAGRNGFSLRAGPPTFNWNSIAGLTSPNGTGAAAGMFVQPNTTLTALDISANGRLPLAFHSTSQQTANISLGSLPAATIDYKVHVRKFDVDIGAISVSYQDDGNHCQSNGTLTSNTSGTGCPGLLNGTGANANLNNDVVLEDVMTAKAGYPGGKLTAAYTAGTDDTSCWEVFFEGQQPGSPGKAHLVE